MIRRISKIIRNVTELVLYSVTVIAAAALICAYLASAVDPASNTFFIPFGLAAPFIIGLNLLLALFWIIRWKPIAFLPVLLLAIGYGGGVAPHTTACFKAVREAHIRRHRRHHVQRSHIPRRRLERLHRQYRKIYQNHRPRHFSHTGILRLVFDAGGHHRHHNGRLPLFQDILHTM